MRNNRRSSDRFQEAGEAWVAADAKARLLEESKTTVLAQMQVKLGDMPVTRAEQIVKASPEWESHIHKMVQAKTEANLAKINLEVMRMRHSEDMSDAANERIMSKLSAA
jgi:hypothetical protein